MNGFMPSRQELKLQAKWKMGHAMGACITLAAALVAAEFLIGMFQLYSGGAIPIYFWSTAQQDIQTGASLSAEGLFAALRLDEVGAGFSVAITTQTAITFVIVQLLSAVVLAPLRMGALENLWAIHWGRPQPFKTIAKWYLDLHRTAHAAGLELILRFVQFALELILAIPGLLILWGSEGDLTRVSAASWLILAGFALSYCIMTQLAPARYLLSRNPDQGALAALRATLHVLRGRRGNYLVFRLSFVILELLATMTRGMFNLYLFPYQSMANMLWLEAAEGRTNPQENALP